jgi:hypothetical protein
MAQRICSLGGSDREELPAQLSYRYLMSLCTAPLNGQPTIWWMDAGFIGEMRAKVLPVGQ